MEGDVYIGVGSNMGDPAARCLEAGARLAGAGGVKLTRSSSLYRTEPVGYEDQDWFVNAVYHLSTGLSPIDLLGVLERIEGEMGKRVQVRWGPRVIDLDILLYGDIVVNEPRLQVPHPKMHERRFVLLPMAEIAPEVRHPVLKKSMAELLSGLGEGQKVEKMRGNAGGNPSGEGCPPKSPFPRLLWT